MSETISIFGISGMGKTTWARKFALEYSGPVFCYDPAWEFRYKKFAFLDGVLPQIQSRGLYLIDEGLVFQSTVAGGRDWLINLLVTRRRYKNTVIMTSHRPQDIDKLMLTLTTRLILFRLTWQSDIDYLREKTGRNIPALDKLAPYQYYNIEV